MDEAATVSEVMIVIPRCSVCSRSVRELIHCGRCSNAGYCSDACLDADTVEHKAACDAGVQLQEFLAPVPVQLRERALQAISLETFLRGGLQVSLSENGGQDWYPYTKADAIARLRAFPVAQHAVQNVSEHTWVALIIPTKETDVPCFYSMACYVSTHDTTTRDNSIPMHVISAHSKVVM